MNYQRYLFEKVGITEEDFSSNFSKKKLKILTRHFGVDNLKDNDIYTNKDNFEKSFYCTVYNPIPKHTLQSYNISNVTINPINQDPFL